MISIDINDSCYNTAMIYPGRMLRYPYVLHGEEVYPIKVDGYNLEKAIVNISENEELILSDFLKKIGAAPINQRIFLLAFAANRNPENMAWKLTRYRDRQKQPISKTIIVLPGGITGADVVAANIFYGGHFFADILFSHELTQNTSIEASIQLVDKKQLEAIHVSEEVPLRENISDEYWGAGVASLPGVFIDMRECRAANTLMYVSAVPIFVSPITNQPIAFKEVQAKGRTILDATQEEMHEHLMKYQEISKLVDIMGLREKLWEYWKEMKIGINNPDIEALYKKLSRVILESGLKNEQGETRTGISEAKKRGLLLTSDETWNIPDKFYYHNI